MSLHKLMMAYFMHSHTDTPSCPVAAVFAISNKVVESPNQHPAFPYLASRCVGRALKST